MNLRIRNFFLLVVFVALSSMTSNLMWNYFGWLILPHSLVIISIALAGEHIVSSQGYYYYTKQETNGPFVRNVPIWIAFLWVFSIQSSLLIAIAFGAEGVFACIISGLLASIGDLILLEPLLSRVLGLWLWTPVKSGYFGFIPSRINRFTAPPGNYIAWLLFPILANCFLGIMIAL